MGKIKEIKFDVTYRLQQYESLKVGATAEVTDGEKPEKLMEELKKFVITAADKASNEYWEKVKNPKPIQAPVAKQAPVELNKGTANVTPPVLPNTTTIVPPRVTVTSEASKSLPGQQVPVAKTNEYEEPDF